MLCFVGWSEGKKSALGSRRAPQPQPVNPSLSEILPSTNEREIMTLQPTTLPSWGGIEPPLNGHISVWLRTLMGEILLLSVKPSDRIIEVR